MKVTGIYSNQPRRQVNFKAIAYRMPQFPMKSEAYMASQYEFFKHAKYYEALDDKIFPNNKNIRRDNYSFLDRMPDFLKGSFVSYFRNLTSFPYLRKTSDLIEQQYIRVMKSLKTSDAEAIFAGYDPTCSVGLGHALPGSDLDKAYVILRKNPDSTTPDRKIVEQFKGMIWHNTDQRILSLNHENTFPEVYTLDQLYNNLDALDDLTIRSGLTRYANAFEAKRQTDLNPVTAGEFNIKLAENNDQYYISKVAAKNFAYFLESVRDGKIIYNTDPDLWRKITDRLRCSPFAKFSNVTQMGAQDRVLKKGIQPIKTKLRNREELPTDFNFWDRNTQYELVKDLVKFVSLDEGPRFQHYFKNDDDIGARYAKLNELLIK